jgi:hypothetical protein
MKQTFFALWAALLLTACGNNAAPKGEETDTVAAEAEETEAAWAKSAFPELYTHLKTQDASFNPALFQETEGGTTTPVPARFFAPEELEPFRPYLVYNKDSSKAIDLVSYNYIIKKTGGQPVLEPAGPDTEIGVIDLKSNMRTRIFFSGPGTTIREAKWLDEQTVLLGGAETITSNSIRPILIRINLEEASLQRFSYADSLQGQLKK